MSPQRSISRIKHDLHRRNAQSAHSPAQPACGSRAQRLPRRARVPMIGRTGHTRKGRHRSVEVAVLTFRVWHVCARCHRNQKSLHAILRSRSELISDRILLLVACRPRARVVRACAVGIARRGAQIGGLGAPCKAGGHRCSLLHGCRCHSAPQFRAIGSPVGRAALRLETGRGHLPFANREGCKRAEIILDAHGSCEQAGPVGWGEPLTLAKK